MYTHRKNAMTSDIIKDMQDGHISLDDCISTLRQRGHDENTIDAIRDYTPKKSVIASRRSLNMETV